MRYLDSTPVCAALCILKSGFLFGAAEFGNHGFYQFQGVGEDEDSPACSSTAFDAGDETVVELEPRSLKNLLQARPPLPPLHLSPPSPPLGPGAQALRAPLAPRFSPLAPFLHPSLHPPPISAPSHRLRPPSPPPPLYCRCRWTTSSRSAR